MRLILKNPKMIEVMVISLSGMNEASEYEASEKIE